MPACIERVDDVDFILFRDYLDRMATEVLVPRRTQSELGFETVTAEEFGQIMGGN